MNRIILKDKHLYLIKWLRLFASYSFVQAIAQGFGLLTGILVVRTLSKEDYACFVIVNTIGAIMNLLSDIGVTNSLSAIGGKFWQDDRQMGSLVKTAMILRMRLVWLVFFAVTPFLTWLLWRNHASISTIAWLIPITFAGVFVQLNAGVLSVVVNLRQQVGRMQALVFTAVLPRLALVGLFAALGLLNAPLAVAASTIAFAGQYLLLKHWVRPQITWDAPPDKTFNRDILALVKRQAPLTIYFCLQGQIGIWLISIFGNVQHVAEVGALGRIGVIFSILISTVSALVIPRFSRCQDLNRLRSHYKLILVGFTVSLLLGTAIAWMFPGILLWLLGAKYAQLNNLVWLAVLAAGTNSLTGLLYTLNINKGWIPPAAIVIPAEIITQIILCLSFDLSSVRDILLIGVLGSLVPGLIHLFFGFYSLNSGKQLKTVAG